MNSREKKPKDDHLINMVKTQGGSLVGGILGNVAGLYGGGLLPLAYGKMRGWNAKKTMAGALAGAAVGRTVGDILGQGAGAAVGSRNDGEGGRNAKATMKGAALGAVGAGAGHMALYALLRKTNPILAKKIFGTAGDTTKYAAFLTSPVGASVGGTIGLLKAED